MPPFGRNEWRKEDFQLLLGSAVHLFWRRSILDQTVAELRDAGYTVIALDAGEWSSQADLHADIAREFSFPAYYGNNMDALNDCLSDIALGEEGAEPKTATALVLDRFDSFVRTDPSAAHALVDIFADNSRKAMLVGHRMVCLLRSDDPQLELAPVGETPVLWNRKEWMKKNRGP